MADEQIQIIYCQCSLHHFKLLAAVTALGSYIVKRFFQIAINCRQLLLTVGAAPIPGALAPLCCSDLLN